MLAIINFYENTTKNHNEITPWEWDITMRMAFQKKNPGKELKKKKMYITEGNTN